jgi:hypothetical protein
MQPKLVDTPPPNVYCRTLMENQMGFIVKLLVLSALLSALIKYAAPSLPIPSTDAIALIFVLLPTVIIAIALAWRFQTQKQT